MEECEEGSGKEGMKGGNEEGRKKDRKEMGH